MMPVTAVLAFLVFASLTSCSFNFELTGQKTALENQVMGSYKELDDEVLLAASVRGVKKDGTVTEKKVQSDEAAVALAAKQNQEFNRDDIDELKAKMILGEDANGRLALVPDDVVKGRRTEEVTTEQLAFAQRLILEENRDRDIVIKRVVTSHQDLSVKDLEEARAVYQKSILERSPEGTWFQGRDLKWQQRPKSSK